MTLDNTPEILIEISRPIPQLGRGWFDFGKINGLPFFLHWTFPGGGVVLSAFVGFKIEQTIYFVLAYTLLIVIHEIGHALGAWLIGLRVIALQVSGFGGSCWVERPKSLRDGLVVYSGGVIAQTFAMLSALAYLGIHGEAHSLWGNCVLFTFIFCNAFVLIINRAPQRRANIVNDGYVLWMLPAEYRRKQSQIGMTRNTGD